MSRCDARGKFIAFEGGEGAGKTTQQRRLIDEMRARQHEVVLTREPGGTPLGQAIRALVMHSEVGAVPCPQAEALLYLADRAQNVTQIVRPALANGVHVVQDRYEDSTMAYQGAGRGLDMAHLSQWAANYLRPDLVIVLNVDPVVGLRRARARHGGPDRIEAEDMGFHMRVHNAFLSLAAAEPSRYCVIDADAPEEIVAAKVWERVRSLVA